MAGSTAPASMRTSGDAAGGVTLRFGLSPTLTQPFRTNRALSTTRVGIFMPLLGCRVECRSAWFRRLVDCPAFFRVLADGVHRLTINALRMICDTDAFAFHASTGREAAPSFDLARIAGCRVAPVSRGVCIL